jgi:tetratricopeptide (TPR) repeat protein
VTDFDLVDIFASSAKDIHVGKVDDESGGETLGFTKVGSICGTPPYMSPEQLLGDRPIDIRSDIYAFGCVLYKIFTRRPPFVCANFDLYRDHHLKIRPQPLSANTAGLPEGVDDLVMKCLEKDPGRRYGDFQMLREDLSQIYFQRTGEHIREEMAEEMREVEFYNKGGSLYNLGRYPEAITCYDKALEINPAYEKAWNNKGCNLAAMEKYDEAILCYDRALAIHPQDTLTLTNKAVALEKVGKSLEALACFEKALEINPRDAAIWNSRGTILINLGQLEEAADSFDKALELNPRFKTAWKNKGATLSKLGKVYEAILCYDRAIEIDFQDAAAYGNRGVAHYFLGHYEQAIHDYSQFIQWNPREAKVFYNRGLTYHKLGRTEQAFDDFKIAAKLGFKPVQDLLRAKGIEW